MRAVLERAERRIKAARKNPRFPLVEVMKVMDMQRLQALKRIDRASHCNRGEKTYLKELIST